MFYYNYAIIFLYVKHPIKIQKPLWFQYILKVCATGGYNFELWNFIRNHSVPDIKILIYTKFEKLLLFQHNIQRCIEHYNYFE